MERRRFMGSAGCGLATFLAGSTLLQGDSRGDSQTPPPPAGAKPKRYKIDIEIFEARPDTWCHKKGDTFKYPEDMGKICPWLLSSMHDFIILLQRGVTLPWKYEGTPYEKVIDPEGLTTEYIRCPDPTANLVAKIIRTKTD
ncbi:MAG: hypothetical protein WCB96_12690 [Candidatus Aminicenantales bacterium]